MAEMSPLIRRLEEFFEVAEAYKRQLELLMHEYPKKRSLNIDYKDLERFDPTLADELIEKPDLIIDAAATALQNLVLHMSPTDKFEPHVRFFNLGDERDIPVESIGADHIQKLIKIKGVITKRAEVKPKVKVALLKCKFCDATYKIPITKNILMPDICESCKRRSLRMIDEESYFVNLQRAEAQEMLERLRGGSPASHIELWLEDDLVNTIIPGDNVEITGILRIRPPSKVKNQASYSKFIDVVHVQRIQREFEEVELTPEDIAHITALAKDPSIFEKMAQSMAPGIYGHEEVKRAIILQLFGGTPNKEMPGGGKIRSDIHLLLIGDPGSAKTRFLQYVANIAPKSIYVSGKSVSGVGLTASADRDEETDGGWVLKAGALVLASGGNACIDEFDKIDERERAALHEVMESQSYHPSTKLLLANGQEVEIGPFVEKLLSENKDKAYLGKDCVILNTGLDEIKVLTTDFVKIYPTSISQVSKHKAPNHFIKITLQTGRTLLVTLEHPIWITANGKITTKPALQIRQGEITLMPAPLPKNGNEISPCKINGIEEVKNEGIEWVYDVGVRPTETFISECAVLHNSVSVAKAGIVARFKAKTSILAAANPKYGRFDPNELPTDQFDIEPTLLSRFDLIFPIRDILDTEKDTKLAEHILSTHKMAGLKLKSKVEEEKRLIDENLLRKYISYARKTISAVLSEEAESKIKEYYIELRKIGQSQGVVPITPRQIEGIIRLSEASAKTRLSNKVELMDAERAIGLVDFVLRQVSLDRQTGRLDIDIISTGQPKSRVEKIIEKHQTIMEIIKDLQTKYDLVEIAKIIEASKEFNIDEVTIKKFIEDKLRHGELYEPKHGYVKIAGT